MEIINKLFYHFYWRSNSKRYIQYLRKHGVKIGANCIFRGSRCAEIDLTRPSLIEIGNYVDMNLNFTILTHDYATSVFLRTYKKFINSSGKVLLGDNIYFGKNCTILKGVTIGDNCIIGAGSLILNNIPSNSVAAGTPAKVICTLDEYYSKRTDLALNEAFEYARSIKNRFNRLPVESDFREEFIHFVSGNEVNNYLTIPIEFQMGEAYSFYKENHKAQYQNFNSFLIAAGVLQS
jgi:acetyltransferase-like isoleucine patch superfamily enzyme